MTTSDVAKLNQCSASDLLGQFAQVVSDNARGAGNDTDALEREILRRMTAGDTCWCMANPLGHTRSECPRP